MVETLLHKMRAYVITVISLEVKSRHNLKSHSLRNLNGVSQKHQSAKEPWRFLGQTLDLDFFIINHQSIKLSAMSRNQGATEFRLNEAKNPTGQQ